MSRRHRAAAVLLLALVTAACSSSSEPEATSTTTAPSTTEPGATTTTTEPATTTTAEPEPTGDGITVDGVSATTDAIYVGLLADLSGPHSARSIDAVDSQLTFWSEVNESGGVADRAVELLVVDTASDPERYQAAYDDLRDRVVMFSHTGFGVADDRVGSQNSNDPLSVADGWYSGWSDPALAPNVVPISSNYCIEAINALSATIERYTTDFGAPPTLAVATEPGAHGEDSAAGIAVMAEVLGLPILYDGTAAITSDVDPAAIGASIAASGATWTWLATNPAMTGDIVSAARAAGYAGQWSGSTPSFGSRLLATEIGDYLAETWLLSMFFAPVGADATGMDDVYADLSEAFPGRYPGEGLIQGYLEFSATEQLLSRAAELGDLTPQGVSEARTALGSLDFAGITPPTNLGEGDDTVVRETALYRPDKVRFDEQGGLAAALSAGAITPYVVERDFFVSEGAEAYFNGTCYLPEDTAGG